MTFIEGQVHKRYHQPSITEIICKIKYLKIESNFPGANELMYVGGEICGIYPTEYAFVCFLDYDYIVDDLGWYIIIIYPYSAGLLHFGTGVIKWLSHAG